MPTSGVLGADFFARGALEVARDLLGTVLVSMVDGVQAAGVVVETEAYGGAEDAASHAATKSGVTKRNRVMFGPPGRAYVYRSYGVHWCTNVVTGPDGDGQAVLLRGLTPLWGREAMLERRGTPPLAAGPGRLSQALGITDALYGHPLDRPPLQLLAGYSVDQARVVVTPRIGISAAAEWPNRFYVVGAPGVSRALTPPRTTTADE